MKVVINIILASLYRICVYLRLHIRDTTQGISQFFVSIVLPNFHNCMPSRHITHRGSLAFLAQPELRNGTSLANVSFPNVCLGSSVPPWTVCAICWSNFSSGCWKHFVLLILNEFFLVSLWWKSHIDVAPCLINRRLVCKNDGKKKSLRIRGGLVSIEPH